MLNWYWLRGVSESLQCKCCNERNVVGRNRASGTLNVINDGHKLGCWVKMPFGESGLAGAAVQFVHSRQTKTSTNNRGKASLQHLHHKLFISKLHFGERTVFLAGRTPLKEQINSADGLSSPLWKRHYVLDGDAQQTRGVWEDTKCVSASPLFCGQGTVAVLDGAAQQSIAFPRLFSQDVTKLYTKKRFQYILHLILSSVIWASIGNNSREANRVPLI